MIKINKRLLEVIEREGNGMWCDRVHWNHVQQKVTFIKSYNVPQNLAAMKWAEQVVAYFRKEGFTRFTLLSYDTWEKDRELRATFSYTL